MMKCGEGWIDDDRQWKNERVKRDRRALSLLLSREERAETHKTKKRENKRTERLLLTRHAKFRVV